MDGSIETTEGRIARLVRRHAVGWWVAANWVGVLLAAELVWPRVGDLLAPLSYGRWMPLHMNWQLYGWGALPIVGALLRWMVRMDHPQAVTHVRVALGVWSLALGLGGLSWLGGVTSGKLFLDWAGWARPVLPLAMMILWTLVAAHAWWWGRTDSGGERVVRWSLVVGLLLVPSALYWAAGREVYPAVNPDSGGATGAALLGSTLGIVAIFGLLPRMLGVGGCNVIRYKRRVFWGAWLGAVGVWAMIDHGNVSHHDGAAILGLGGLILWVPGLAWFWRSYHWCDGARPWMTAALVWWALLVGSGWVTFLPGVSEQLKFTNGLVAHAHLAMAGLVASVNGMILNQLNPSRPMRRGFVWWQGATAVHVVVLLIVGAMEQANAETFFNGAGWVQVGYGLRLAAGVVMAIASVRMLGETGVA